MPCAAHKLRRICRFSVPANVSKINGDFKSGRSPILFKSESYRKLMIRTFTECDLFLQNNNVHLRGCIESEEFYHIFLSLKDLAGLRERLKDNSTFYKAYPASCSRSASDPRSVDGTHLSPESITRSSVNFLNFRISAFQISCEFQPIKRHCFALGKKLRSHQFGVFARKFLFFTFFQDRIT